MAELTQSSSRFRRILLPGIILQSVLIGGGYATGREIVEYGGKFGASGWISGLAIFFGFSLISILSMEACRQWQVYDYKSLLKKLIGKGWFAYEIVYLLLAILIIAVMASAAGEILNNTLGFNRWVGVILIIVLVGFLNYKGDDVIAKLETIGTIALFAAYIIFAITVFSSKGAEIISTFSQWDTSYVDDAPSLFLLLWTGILYVGYNLAVYPSSFFTYKGIHSRRESISAGIISGLLMTVPWFLTYFALMAYYPDKNVLASTVPWLMILKEFHPALIVIFGIVVGWTLVETATGMIHAFIHRVEMEITERNAKPLKDRETSRPDEVDDPIVWPGRENDGLTRLSGNHPAPPILRGSRVHENGPGRGRGPQPPDGPTANETYVSRPTLVEDRAGS